MTVEPMGQNRTWRSWVPARVVKVKDPTLAPPHSSPRLLAPPLLQIRPTLRLHAFCAGAGSSPRPPRASGDSACPGGG